MIVKYRQINNATGRNLMILKRLLAGAALLAAASVDV
jgi:hypothetical protein